MELLKLDSTMQPNEAPITDYDSLIWTERFNTVGDFACKTGNIEYFMNALPKGQLVSLRDSNIVMEVETHEIERPKNAPATLSIRGRAWESILDRRLSLKSLTDRTEWKVNVKQSSDLAHYVIKKICSEGLLDVGDIFPPTKVVFPTPLDYLTGTGPTVELVVNRGNLLATVVALLQTDTQADPTTSPASPAYPPHGIRAVRPAPQGTTVAIEIYAGVDRTDTVIFSGLRDALDSGKYLFSTVGSANFGYILGPSVSAKMAEGSVVPTGFERRAMLIDATSSGVDSLPALRHEASMSLAQAAETAMFDGAINEDLQAYRYGIHYGLGDIVRLDGDYGLSQKARVTEYIRSYDNTGYKAYPTLTTVLP